MWQIINISKGVILVAGMMTIASISRLIEEILLSLVINMLGGEYGLG